jgi:hypothetical protein
VISRPFRAVLLTVTLAMAATAQSQEAVPTNASANFGGGWSCNLGYRRVGVACQKVDVPANATAIFGGG